MNSNRNQVPSQQSRSQTPSFTPRTPVNPQPKTKQDTSQSVPKQTSAKADLEKRPASGNSQRAQMRSLFGSRPQTPKPK